MDLEPEIRAGGEGWEDPTTGLPGPRFWRHILAIESARSARYDRPATVLFAELTGLEELVGLLGHDIADQAVRAVAAALRSGSRTSDHLSRLHGGRFGLILTETDEIAAINFVDRVTRLCAHRLGPLDDAQVIFAWASSGRSGTLMDAVQTAERWLVRQSQHGAAAMERAAEPAAIDAATEPTPVEVPETPFAIAGPAEG